MGCSLSTTGLGKKTSAVATIEKNNMRKYVRLYKSIKKWQVILFKKMDKSYK